MGKLKIKLCIVLTVLSLAVGATQALHASEALVETTAADRTEARLFKPKSSPGRLKIGLALGGGGARGAAHIGVLKVLDQAGIKFDCVSGTSVGSVIGGFYCAGVSPIQMQHPFESGEVMRHFMTVPLWFRIIAAPVIFIPRLLGFEDYDGLYKGNAFREYLVERLPEDRRTIESLNIPFCAVALNLVDGKPYMIKKGNLGLAMQASSAVPSLRKPVEFDGQLLVDGGVVCNLPVKQCREMGADFVIAVNINEPFKIEPLHTFRKPGSVARRMLAWALYDGDQPQSAMADIVIHPDTDGISLVSTRKSDAKRALAAGEAAARKALPMIKERLREIQP